MQGSDNTDDGQQISIPMQRYRAFMLLLRRSSDFYSAYYAVIPGSSINNDELRRTGNELTLLLSDLHDEMETEEYAGVWDYEQQIDRMWNEQESLKETLGTLAEEFGGAVGEINRIRDRLIEISSSP